MTQQDFEDGIEELLHETAGAPVSAAELTALALPDFLRMNIRVVDAKDRVIAEGRDLAAIRKKLYGSGVAPSNRREPREAVARACNTPRPEL